MGRGPAADKTGGSAARHDSERALIRSIARKFPDLEQSDLEAELWIKLLKLKSRRRKRVRNRTAYFRTALFLHVSNLLRDRPETEKRSVPVPEPDDEGGGSASVRLSYSESNLDNQIALQAVLQEFTPNLRLLWDTLAEVGGNQRAAAKHLRKHRNTIRLWLQQIRGILSRHELP